MLLDAVGDKERKRLALLGAIGANRTLLPCGLIEIFFFKSSHFSLNLNKIYVYINKCT